MFGELFDGDFMDFCRCNQIELKILKNVGSKIKGFCYYDGESYNVFLNNRFDNVQLKMTVVHELIHILENHFSCNPIDLYQCENEVENIINQLKYRFV